MQRTTTSPRRLWRHYTTNAKAYLQARLDAMYMSPRDARLIQIVGGTVLILGAFRKHGKPLTIVLSRGRLLRSERFRRAVINDDGVLANDVLYALKIYGPEYEHDVLKQYQLDEQFKSQGYRVKWIPERWLWSDPERVRASVQQFVYS